MVMDITNTPTLPAPATAATPPMTTHPATMDMDTASTTDATATTDTPHANTEEDTTTVKDIPPTLAFTSLPTEAILPAPTVAAGITALSPPLTTEAGECECSSLRIGLIPDSTMREAHVSRSSI